MIYRYPHNPLTGSQSLVTVHIGHCIVMILLYCVGIGVLFHQFSLISSVGETGYEFGLFDGPRTMAAAVGKN